MKQKKLAIVLAASVFVGLALLLFWPQPVEGTPLGSLLANLLASLFDPSGEARGLTMRELEKWLNFLVFVPFSGLLFFVFERHAIIWSLMISISLSLIAEISQLLFLPSRVASAEDFALNSAGSLLGVCLVSAINRLRKLRQPKP